MNFFKKSKWSLQNKIITGYTIDIFNLCTAPNRWIDSHFVGSDRSNGTSFEKFNNRNQSHG